MRCVRMRHTHTRSTAWAGPTAAIRGAGPLLVVTPHSDGDFGILPFCHSARPGVPGGAGHE